MSRLEKFVCEELFVYHIILVKFLFFYFVYINLQFLPILTAEYRMFRKKSILMSVFTNHIVLCIFTYLCQ